MRNQGNAKSTAEARLVSTLLNTNTMAQVSFAPLLGRMQGVHFAPGTKEGKEEGDIQEDIAKRKAHLERKKVG